MKAFKVTLKEDAQDRALLFQAVADLQVCSIFVQITGLGFV
jgi:hypothetical protein